MSSDITAYCILGSNQGHRAATLRRAVFLLADAPRVDILQASHLYETEPWGQTDQDRFLNAAVELRTTLPPEELLDCFQDIERRLGRTPSEERWGPRVIDLDLALYADQSIETPRLTVPHAHLSERAFALTPLLEIAPNISSPEGTAYSLALERLAPEDADIPRQLGKLALSPPLSPQREAPTKKSQQKVDANLTAADPDALCLPTNEPLLYLSHSQEATERLSESLGRLMQGGETLALVGNLGAGKTCFARGLARGLGIPGNITSPSYVLVKSYEGRLALHHADFYRLTQAQGPAHEELDLASLGLDDYLEDPEAVVLIEWADHFPNWLEPPFYQVEITGRGDSPRAIHLRRIS